MHNDGAVVGKGVVDRTFITRAPRLECSGRDIVLQQLMIHYVYQSRYQCFDVLGTRYQRLNISYSRVSV